MYYDPNEVPACPAVRILIIDNTSGASFGPFDALVDTGADTTCVPNSIANRIPNLTYSFHPVDYGDGSKPETTRFVSIDDATVQFLDSKDQVLLTGRYSDLLLRPIDSGLLGRDILNFHICEFDGPSLTCIIR